MRDHPVLLSSFQNFEKPKLVPRTSSNERCAHLPYAICHGVDKNLYYKF